MLKVATGQAEDEKTAKGKWRLRALSSSLHRGNLNQKEKEKETAIVMNELRSFKVCNVCNICNVCTS